MNHSSYVYAKKGKDFDKTKKDYDNFKTKNANIKLNVKNADKLKEVAKNPLLTDIGKESTIKRNVEITFKMKNNFTDNLSDFLNKISTGSKNNKKAQGDIVKITQNANADYKKRYGRPLFT